MIKPEKELSKDTLLEVLALSANATAIYTSEDIHIQFANDAMIALWGKNRRVIGKNLAEAVPELAGQPFIDLLKNVWQTGKIYTGTEVPAVLKINGLLKTSYFDFVYSPLKDTNGKTYCILHTAADVTERVNYKSLSREKAEREQHLNEALTAANEELAVANEEMTSLNEEMAVTNEELRSLNEEYFATNEELTSLNEQYTTTNENLVSLNIAHEALNSELEQKNAALEKLNDELNSVNNERLTLNEELNVTNEELQSMNAEFEVLNEELKATNDELHSLNDAYLSLNEKVTVALETANLAKSAANLGTFDLDIINDNLEWDDRCKELFGLNPDVTVTYTADFVNGLHPDDKKRVLKAVADAYNFSLSEGNYDVNYRTIGAGDKKLRWIRAIGKVLFNIEKEPQRFIGTVIDITEQKEDEQRKNDFIGMVSHELKTPLTSLNGYLQVMQSKNKQTEDTFLGSMLDRSVSQIKKMTGMINGFLNVARFESGQIHIDKQEFDVAELIKEAEEETIATINTHTVVFQQVEQTIIFADKEKIGQVINNFINNAVKYSPQGSVITIACVTTNGFAKVTVTDQGMGISQANLNKLFDRYYRVEGTHMKSISGFGIGLYLCSEIIKRHSGQIGVQSEIGRGSDFWFTLPLI